MRDEVIAGGESGVMGAQFLKMGGNKACLDADGKNPTDNRKKKTNIERDYCRNAGLE